MCTRKRSEPQHGRGGRVRGGSLLSFSSSLVPSSFSLYYSLYFLRCLPLPSLPSFVLSFSLFSSLPFTPTNTVFSTDQQTWRPTLRRLNVMWCTVFSKPLPTTCTECSHLSSSLLFPPPSSLPPTPKKKNDICNFKKLSGGGFFPLPFKFIGKIKKRIKLQFLHIRVIRNN